MQQKLLNQSTPNLLSILAQQEFFVTIFKLIFFRFLKISGTLDHNLGPKYLKEFDVFHNNKKFSTEQIKCNTLVISILLNAHLNFTVQITA